MADLREMSSTWRRDKFPEKSQARMLKDSSTMQRKKRLKEKKKRNVQEKKKKKSLKMRKPRRNLIILPSRGEMQMKLK